MNRVKGASSTRPYFHCQKLMKLSCNDLNSRAKESAEDSSREKMPQFMLVMACMMMLL